jgi:Flp pilus assembly protein TadD
VADETGDGAPSGDVYDWYRRGMRLLAERSPAAAAAVLEHAVRAEPDSRNLREALARAQFNAGQFALARENFARIVDQSPTEDYAHFGRGLASARLGDYEDAAEHLAIAVAMRPDNAHYTTALRNARAQLAR